MDEQVGVGVLLLHRLGQRDHALVPVGNHFALVLDGVAAVVLLQRQRRKLHGRHAEEQKVARPRCVYLLDQAAVARENGIVQRAVVQPPRVADVVDADEEGEERVRRGPGGVGRVRAVAGDELLFDLVCEREDGGCVGGDEGGVDGCATVGQVVGFDEGSVVGCGEEAGPVGAIRGGPAAGDVLGD